MRNFVFGDTGGHGNAFIEALVEIGIDIKTMKLPEDVRIIHLGDLIHKGPDSNILLQLVDQLIDANPDHWIQLLGNHEFQHIKGAPAFWRCDCDVTSVGIINNWWVTGKATASFALPSFTQLEVEVSAKPKLPIPKMGMLFTHSGLTRPFWKEIGSQPDAVATSLAINAAPIKVVSRPGVMLYNPHVQNHNPGPAWALASDEVFNSWNGAEMPFIQIHGHTTPFSWMYKNWFPGTSRLFRSVTKLNPISRLSITEVGGSLLLGCDPGFSERVDLKVQPYLYFES
jgi:hypothetical protein